MSTILPVLQPPDWPGRGEASHRPLVHLPDADDVPLVSWATELASVVSYVGPSFLEKFGRTIDEVDGEARKNLATRPADWRTLEPEPGLLIALLEGEYAGERILDADVLRNAQTLLKTGPMAVGVPYRGVLMATAMSNAMDGRFPTIVRSFFEKHRETRGLSAIVLTVDDGHITGRVRRAN